MATTAQTSKVEHAVTSVCPWQRASDLEAFRKRLAADKTD